jgi:hypothetical protein
MLSSHPNIFQQEEQLQEGMEIWKIAPNVTEPQLAVAAQKLKEEPIEENGITVNELRLLTE